MQISCCIYILSCICHHKPAFSLLADARICIKSTEGELIARARRVRTCSHFVPVLPGWRTSRAPSSIVRRAARPPPRCAYPRHFFCSVHLDRRLPHPLHRVEQHRHRRRWWYVLILSYAALRSVAAALCSLAPRYRVRPAKGPASLHLSLPNCKSRGADLCYSVRPPRQRFLLAARPICDRHLVLHAVLPVVQAQAHQDRLAHRTHSLAIELMRYHGVFESFIVPELRAQRLTCCAGSDHLRRYRHLVRRALRAFHTQ